MLISFSGLPGAGKSTTAQELARQLHAVYLSIDSVQQVTGDYPEAYRVAQSIAEDNLRLGLTVITDCVNPHRQSRDAWRAIATEVGASTLEVEVVCLDKDVHLRRLPRVAARREGEPITMSEEVMQWYQPWDRERVVVDTARCTPDDAVAEIRRALSSISADR